jgi:outer membrane lipase/esterase
MSLSFQRTSAVRSLAVPRTLSAAALAAALAATGTAHASEADTGYDRIVVFGDSISDSGSYADKAPAGAGKFTTNPDDVWVEVMAKDLGLDLKPHAAGGSNYAEGGARVALQRPDAPGDLTRRPVTEQVADFMANDGKLTKDSLVIIQGGGNDVFATKFNGPADTPADLEVLRVAAEGLADQVGLLIAAGAGTVVTTSVPKFEHYNERYDAALVSRGLNVLYVDMAGLIGEIETNPSEFGIVNVTDKACRGFALESFTCLPQNYVTPDANRTYLYADGVHFTGVVQEIEGDLTLAMLRAPGQFAQLPHMIRSASRADGDLARQQLDQNALPGLRVIGGVKVSGTDLPASAAAGIGQTTAAGAQLGFATSLGSGFTAGLYASWTAGDGDFAADTGSLRFDSYALTAFAGYRRGPFSTSLATSLGTSDFSAISRRIVLGPAVRTEGGRNDASFGSIELRAAYDIAAGPLRIAPFATARYDRIAVDGYSEAGARSSQVRFADQRLETLELGGGIRLTPRASGDGFAPWAEIGYADDVLNAPHRVSILPNGAPVWFTSEPLGTPGGALTYGIGVAGPIGERSQIGFALRGREANSGQSEMSATLSASIRF